jgi:hypothetical protein
MEKIQSRLRETLAQKEKSYQEKYKELEQTYKYKIEALKDMLENKAQK